MEIKLTQNFFGDFFLVCFFSGNNSENSVTYQKSRQFSIYMYNCRIGYFNSRTNKYFNLYSYQQYSYWKKMLPCSLFRVTQIYF